MVSEDEFWKVQVLLGKAGRRRPRVKKHFAYTGMIRCGECGGMVTAEEKRKRYGPSGTVRLYTYYHCTRKKEGKQRGVRCRQPSIEVKELEAQMEAVLDSISISEAFRDWALRLLKDQHAARSQEEQAKRVSIKRAYQSAQRQLDELLNIRLRSLIDDEEFEKKRGVLLREKRRLQNSLDDPAQESHNVLERAGRACRFATSLGERFRTGTVDEKRTILETVGSNLTLQEKKLTFEPVKPFGYFANTGQKSRWRAIVEDVRTFCSQHLDGSFVVPIISSLNHEE
jgi:hypothetical protein